MTGDVQSEWRRGGPGKTPIDKPGDWQCRDALTKQVSTRIYHVTVLSDELRVPMTGSRLVEFHYNGARLATLNDLDGWEWRFIGHLPTEQPAPEAGGRKGDREERRRAFQEAVREWRTTAGTGIFFTHDDIVFLESPAGIAAFDALTGRDSKPAVGHEVYVQLIGNGMPEGLSWDEQGKWLWKKFDDDRKEIENLRSRLSQSEGETESGEETSFDAISDAFFRYCKTHDEEDAKRLLAFMGGMSYAIHPWEAERHGS